MTAVGTTDRADRIAAELAVVASAHARLRRVVDDLEVELLKAQERIGRLERHAGMPTSGKSSSQPPDAHDLLTNV